MTTDNFLYWIQGYFELEKPSKIDEDKIAMIQEHILLVTHKNEFINWLQGFLEAVTITDTVIRKKSIKIIMNKLEDQFLKLSSKGLSLSELEKIIKDGGRPAGGCQPPSYPLPRDPFLPFTLPDGDGFPRLIC